MLVYSVGETLENILAYGNLFFWKGKNILIYCMIFWFIFGDGLRPIAKKNQKIMQKSGYFSFSKKKLHMRWIFFDKL